MASISLRSYNKEIEHLIDQGQIDEALGHCMHILQSVPKHLGTYRLLGKALLEAKRFSDATDIFQRVLSAVPDDFVANVGLSIIRENENNLDMAIWHMERAFESQPANSVVQDELRRLYGRRDGVEPPKIRLTRGALARMYVRGHLYRQAIGELRAALAEDPQRPDLQALLADMYYRNGQKVEAVDMCSTLLKKYPFCFEANRILTVILPETERKDDAVVYLQRIISLDPYYGKLADGQTSSDQVPDQAITLEKLSYQPGQGLLQAPVQPEWAASLGTAFQPAKVTDELPDWLTTPEGGEAAPAPVETGAAPAEEVVSAEEIAPAVQEETLPDWLSQAKAPAQLTEEKATEATIPEFLKEAGWEPSTGEFDEKAAALEMQTEETPATETPAQEISKAELPDWLQQMAPPEAEAPQVEMEAAGEVPPWLQETPPGSSDTIIGWLKAIPKKEPGEGDAEIPPAEETKEAEGKAAEEVTEQGWPQGEEVQLPDWLSEQNQRPTGVTDMLPSWLPESQKPVVADSGESLTSETSAEIPDWLKGIKEEIAPSTPQVEAPPGEEAVPEAISEAPAEDWLASISQPAEAPPGEEAAPEAVSEAPAEDWLAGISQPAEAGEEIQAEAPAHDELADWLKSLDTTPVLEETPAEEPPLTWEAAIAAVSATEEAPAGPSLEETLEPEATPAEEPVVGEFPDWLQALETTEAIEEAAPQEEAEISLEEAPEAEAAPAEEPAAAEIPDWLQGLETTEAVEEAAPQAEAEPSIEEALPAELELPPATELPEWLSEIETAAVPAEETAEVAPEMLEETRPSIISQPSEPVPEAEPALEAPPTPETAFNLEDPEAAMAWLESLAAQQGIPQEQLTTAPEERPLTPGWLEQAGQEAEARGELSTYVPTETTQVPQVPAELTEPAGVEEPTQVVPIKTSITHEPEPEPKPAEEIPDWLIGIETAAVLAEETMPAIIEEPVEAEVQEKFEEAVEMPVEPAAVEEIPDWLKEAETTQPAAEAELESTTPPSQAVPMSEPAFNLEDPEAALAWLESLAAQQGIPQEQLTTAPEERPVTPEWLEQAGEEAEALGELAEYTPTETTQAFQPPVEILPPAAEEGVLEAPTPEPLEEVQPTEEMPDWLRAMEQTEPAAAIQPEPEIPELAPDWLQEFEAIAEQKEVSQPVPAKPEEPVAEEELPSWLQEEVTEEEAELSEIPEAPTWVSEKVPQEAQPAMAEVAPQVEPEITPAEAEIPQKLDLNTASLRELENLPGMGFILAQTIIAYRETNGPFSEVEELIAVPGMEEALLDQVKELLEVKVAPKKATLADRIAEPKDQAENLLMEARRLLVAKDFAKASDNLQELMQKRIYLPEIIRDLQEVMDSTPDNIYLWQSLGDAFMRNDQLQEALNAYTKAERLLR